MKMTPEVKEKWLAALRSGEYEQARNDFMATKDGKTRYCCLAVLTDLAIKEGVQGVRPGVRKTGEPMVEVCTGYDGQTF